MKVQSYTTSKCNINSIIVICKQKSKAVYEIFKEETKSSDIRFKSLF